MNSERLKAGMAEAPLHIPGDLDGIDNLDAESLGLFCFADQRPLSGVAGFVDWRLCGAISRLLLGGLFSGQRDETLMLPVTGTLSVRRVFLFGLGQAGKTNRTGLTGSCGLAIEVMRRAGVEQIFLGQPALRRDAKLRDLFMDVTSRTMSRHISGLLIDPRK